MNRRIAIIPARGGSTRLPRKNILPLHGLPLIAWTINAAKNSGTFDRVVVSTDDVEIAEIARHNGAEVPFLRGEYADNYSPSSLATLETLEQAESYWGETFDIVAQLLPTCPLRGADITRAGMQRFETREAPAQISVFDYGWMNPWWAMKCGSDGQPDWLFPAERVQRSQDLDTLYCPSGALWIARAEVLRQEKTFYAPGHVVEPIPWQTAVDIDDEQDFHMAEVMLSLNRRMESLDS